MGRRLELAQEFAGLVWRRGLGAQLFCVCGCSIKDIVIGRRISILHNAATLFPIVCIRIQELRWQTASLSQALPVAHNLGDAASVRNPLRMDDNNLGSYEEVSRTVFKILRWLLASKSERQQSTSCNPSNRRRLEEGVTYAWNQISTRYSSIARGPGDGAGSESTGRGRDRRSAGLPLRLLRSSTLRLRTGRLLRAGILLQRDLPWRGSLGRLGLRPRLGRASLPRRRRRTLSWPRRL